MMVICGVFLFAEKGAVLCGCDFLEQKEFKGRQPLSGRLVTQRVLIDAAHPSDIPSDPLNNFYRIKKNQRNY